MQQDRYCRNCGQELQPEDRFCAGCGRSVHATAHVPTPEADVPVPPPVSSSQAPGSSLQEQQPSEIQAAARGPVWGMLTVFLVLGIVETVEGMLPAASGEDLGYRIGYGVGAAITPLFLATALILLISGVTYVATRKDGGTFREAVFNWPLVILAGGIAVLFLLG